MNRLASVAVAGGLVLAGLWMIGVFGFWGLVFGGPILFAAWGAWSRRRIRIHGSTGHSWFSGTKQKASWTDYGNDYDHAQEDSNDITISDTAFRSFFQVAGYIAKSDGRVSSAEIAATTQLMQDLNLDPTQANTAQECFTEGKSPNFNVNQCLQRLESQLRLSQFVATVLFEALVRLSGVDGFSETKVSILLRFAQAVGVREGEARAYILAQQEWYETGQSHNQQRSNYGGQSEYERQYREQQQRTYEDQQYRQSSEQQEARSSRNELADAYRVLGVDSNEADDKVKLAYRRLIQESHPDKLQAMNLPAFLMESAKEKTQEVQAAWELIRDARGIR